MQIHTSVIMYRGVKNISLDFKFAYPVSVAAGGKKGGLIWIQRQWGVEGGVGGLGYFGSFTDSPPSSSFCMRLSMQRTL